MTYLWQMMLIDHGFGGGEGFAFPLCDLPPPKNEDEKIWGFGMGREVGERRKR